MNIQAEVVMLDESEGGRKPPKLFNGYRPHMVINPNELLGIIFTSVPDKVLSNQVVKVGLSPAYLGTVDYSAVIPGAKFQIVEGARVVGNGHIIST